CMVNCLIGGQDGSENNIPDIELPDMEDSKQLVTRLATPMFGPNGEVAGCLTILQDHSPLVDLINRVHHEERSLKIILDNLDIGIFTVNRGCHITFYNKAAERISGYDRGMVLGKTCGAIFGVGDADDLSLLKESMTDGKARTTRHGRLAAREGESVPIRADLMALRNEKGTIVGGMATFQDLTLAHHLDQVIRDRYTFKNMVGKDPAMRAIFEKAGVVAATDATVLIEGATGTGKDLLAKVIHSASPRADKPMIKVNCAALPDNLLESEMFGYVKGAFTGADRDKPGRFQMADGGAIFLDEIGDLPLPLQAKLLRVIEDKEFNPLGSHGAIKVDVRIISATNRGLEKLVEERLFRKDLFYRLNVIRIELPPIKDRRSDLPLLLGAIMRKLCAARAHRPPLVSEKAMEILLNYHYPGNVRELENILEHALIISRCDVIQPHHLPDYVLNHLSHRNSNATPERAVPLLKTANGERERILKALKEHNGRRAETARSLGIDRTTLWRKMKRMGIGE
ncbi:MAG: PAS domain-containing protein, partial [Desulfobacterales bacterium]|nr:PAS domain-containing protein [Desulfobacterales bacterium]